MQKLNLFSMDPIRDLAIPNVSQDISMTSSALEVFTDFRLSIPLVIEPGASVSHAHETMLRSHVRLLLVVEKDGQFVGVISLDDIDHQHVVKKVSQGFALDELRVKDFMRSRHSLKAFSHDELKHATIGDVINVLENSGETHCLVIDRKKQRIRGIISTTDIAKKLKLPVGNVSRPNFAEIFSSLYHQINPEEKIIERA